MQRLFRMFRKPWFPLTLLAGAVVVTVLRGGRPFPMDDHFLYQSFIEALAHGKLDLTIAGFHGSDFFAVPWYRISGSSIAQIQVLLCWAIALPVLGFFAGRTLYRRTCAGFMLSGIIALMPFVSFVAWRGWTGAAYWGLMLLSIALARRVPLLAGTALAFAILTKPFAIALLPLLWALAPRGSSLKRFRGLIPALVIPVLYTVVQYGMAGRIIVGAHADVDAVQLVLGLRRIILNLAHGVQILFSIHNYYFPDPSLTGPGNLLHTSPVLMFLGIFALLLPSLYFEDRKVWGALFIGAAAGFVLAAGMDHMDHFYMEAGVLLLILASLPALRRHVLWVPIALATLHFQWLYFFLQFREPFHLTRLFFLVPAVADALFFVWGCSWIPVWLRHLRRWWAGFRFRHWFIGPARSTRVQFFRYFWVGGISTVIDFSVFAFCLRFLGMHYLLAQFFAYCVGFVANYLLSILWVFQKTNRMAREIAVLFLLTMLGLLWTELLLYLFIDGIHWMELPSKICATIIVLFWNFGARRFIVYRNPPKR